MSNYTKATDFAAKDALPSGDAAKVIKGAEFEDEFDAIATAVNSKADIDSPTFTGTVTVPGVTTTANVSFGDNDKATFGASNDLAIYHDGSNSYLEDVGTGNFIIRTNGAFLAIQNNADEDFIGCNPSTGSVTLYHNNDSVLQTSASGVDITGTADMDTLSLDGTAVTATAAELNVLDGVTATTTELNYVDGVTSNIQTQLDAKVSDSDFTQSLASNGWTELPNGLIIQWGRVLIGAESSNESVSFPKAFTTACFQVVANAEDDSITRTRNDFIGTTTPTTTAFSITNGINTALYFRFIAIGH